MTSEIKTILVTGGLTLAGVIVAEFAGIVRSWVKQRWEDRSRKREILIKSAIEDWSRSFEAAVKQGGKIMPLSNYIAHYFLLLKSIFEDDFDLEKFRLDMEKADSVTMEFAKRDQELKKKVKNALTNE